MSKINIISEESRASAIGLLQSLNLEHKWAVTVEKRKDKRSLDQNGLWNHWADYIAGKTGNDPEMVKFAFREMFLPMKSVTLGGQRHDVVPSTTSLSVGEMAQFLDQVSGFCASEMAMILPKDRDEHA